MQRRGDNLTGAGTLRVDQDHQRQLGVASGGRRFGQVVFRIAPPGRDDGPLGQEQPTHFDRARQQSAGVAPQVKDQPAHSLLAQLVECAFDLASARLGEQFQSQVGGLRIDQTGVADGPRTESLSGNPQCGDWIARSPDRQSHGGSLGTGNQGGGGGEVESPQAPAIDGGQDVTLGKARGGGGTAGQQSHHSQPLRGQFNLHADARLGSLRGGTLLAQ